MLLGELEIGGGAFLRTIQNMDTKFSGFLGNLGKVGAVAGGGFAAFAGVNMVLEAFGQALDLGGTLQDLSTATGESAGDLVILRQAFENAGIGADGAGDFLLKLQDSISGVNESGKSTAGALKDLGVSAAELRTMSALEQLDALSKGFEKLDQTQKVQVARDLFGKSGGKALALLGDPEALQQAREQAAPLAQLMEKNVGAFDKLGDVINGLKLNLQEFFAGALSQIAPEATSIADALASIDFVGIGEGVGALGKMFLKLVEILTLVAPLVNAISDGMSWLLGTGNSSSSALAQSYRGFSRTQRDAGAGGGDKTQVDSFAKVGLGGNVGGADPLLVESQRQTVELQQHTRLLQQVAGRIGGPAPIDFPAPA